MGSIDELAKANPLIRKLHQYLFMRGTTRIDVVATFPEFAPASRGSYRMLAPLTVQTITHLSSSFLDLAARAHTIPEPVRVENFAISHGPGDPEAISALFDHHGSDKTQNQYSIAYAAMLKHPERVTKVMEIGLGTNNRDVVSHMGLSGRPGASLRAFRDFLPGAMIYGADIDARILFQEERIRTVQVDQTDPVSFQVLGEEIGDDFDLMIDDGLHSIDANFHSLAFFLDRLKPGGYAVVEDIPLVNERFWQLAALVLKERFECHIVRCRGSHIFVCRMM